MNSTFKITTGFTILAIGIWLIFLNIYTQILNIKLFGSYGIIPYLLILIFISVIWLIINPNSLSLTCFSIIFSIFFCSLVNTQTNATIQSIGSSKSTHTSKRSVGGW